MPGSTLFLLLLPLILLISVVGSVVIVALIRSKPEDIPLVLKESAAVFRRLAERVPTTSPGQSSPAQLEASADASPTESLPGDEEQKP